MATQEVSKYSVYDPRIVQKQPKYAVEKGALSITNVSFNAQTANSSSQQFNVVVPSENVFIDRAVDWISGGVVSAVVTVGVAGQTLTVGQPLLVPGRDVAPAQFPSHQCVAQMTATINDATVTVNTQDVLNYVLRLQDMRQHRRQRTCPTMLDIYGLNPDTLEFPNSPLSGQASRYASDESPNGAWSQWSFCDSTGTPLLQNAAGAAITGSSALNYGGIPCTAALAGVQAFTVYLRWQSTEKLMLPPFIFGNAFELSTGLFGVQNFQVQMNMSTTPSRAWRVASSWLSRVFVGTAASSSSPTISVFQWVTAGVGSYSPYPLQPALSVQFLTPALDVPLPAKSIVPYMEFPRYITTGITAVPSTLGAAKSAKGLSIGQAGGPSSGTQVSSNTITLPNIPDLLLIYLKPAIANAALFTTQPYANAGLTWDSTIGDFTLPIEAISINFDNFSGLLANHTQYELYKMSIDNGLEMDFPEWSGESRGFFAAAAATPPTDNALVTMVGGPLVLRPGRDFALQAGQAPGLVGNFTLQISATVSNQFPSQIAASGVNLYIVPVSSGFFETIKGSSRIIKGVLTEQDILSAPATAPSSELERPVGSGKHGRHSSSMAAYMK